MIRGIRTHILLTVVGVVVVGFGLIYLVVTPLFRTGLIEDRIARAHWLSVMLVDELRRSCENRDDASRRVQQWDDSLGDTCLAIVGGDGEFVGNGRTLAAICVGPNPAGTLLGLEPGQQRFLGNVFAVATAIPDGLLRERLGTGAKLLFLQNFQPVEDRVTLSSQLVLLFMLLGVALVSILGYAVMTHLVIRPTSRVMKTMERVSEGDLNAHVEPTGSYELRALADSFNQLTSKLREDEAHIHRQIAELQDINAKLERATDSLLRSEKMASVGKLAAGVAHEIGNPISIILGYLEMLGRSDATAKERDEWLGQTSNAVRRVDAIIRDLLDFSRLEPQDADDVTNVGEVIRGTAKLMEPQSSFQDVALTLDLADSEIHGAISDSRLQQVLINVLMNAADAMGSSEGNASVEVGLSSTESHAIVTIQDSGPGIGPQDRRRLFDPFFTTKEPGSGTGLGLSVCYSIMASCGGDIRCESTLGKGALFTLEIPLADPA